MANAELNLSGDWKGIFNYPRSLPPSQFDAELRDYMGALTGETFEVGDGPRSKGQPMHALLQGQRNGSDVSFVKRYDDLRHARNPVHYSGRANEDGTEVSGTWNIPGHWSGTFLMVRNKPEVIAIERKVEETVR